MADYFVYKAFGLVTPYMVGKGFSGDIDVKRTGLSVCGTSMYNLHYNLHYDGANLTPFSMETLQDIVRSRYDDERELCEHFGPGEEEDFEKALPLAKKAFEDKLNNREALEELVGDFIDCELEHGNYKPADYPMRNLFQGVFHDHNWCWLSDDDFWKIARCYGVDVKDGKDTAIRAIINTQNFLVTELLLKGYKSNFATRGVDTLTPLLQNVLTLTYEESVT